MNWETHPPYQIVKCFDPRVLIEERFLLLSRPLCLANADTLQTRILCSDPPNKRLGNTTSCVVVEMLEKRKCQDRKETFRGH